MQRSSKGQMMVASYSRYEKRAVGGSLGFAISVTHVRGNLAGIWTTDEAANRMKCGNIRLRFFNANAAKFFLSKFWAFTASQHQFYLEELEKNRLISDIMINYV